MFINTTGLVLRETAYKDSSKMLTVLTGGEGKLSVAAKGARRKNSKLAAATQLLVFSEMTLLSARERWTLTEARSIEQFIGLRADIALLSLGSYFAELAETVADEDSPNNELLPLCLNALFALSEGMKKPEHIKPAFELRLMGIAGFAPLVTHCAECGEKEPGRAFLDMAGGVIRCGNHARTGDMELSRGALNAMRYIIGCDPKKIFSFSLGGAALRELAGASENYLLTHLERSFRTLDFYKGIM